MCTYLTSPAATLISSPIPLVRKAQLCRLQCGPTPPPPPLISNTPPRLLSLSLSLSLSLPLSLSPSHVALQIFFLIRLLQAAACISFAEQAQARDSEVVCVTWLGSNYILLQLSRIAFRVVVLFLVLFLVTLYHCVCTRIGITFNRRNCLSVTRQTSLAAASPLSGINLPKFLFSYQMSISFSPGARVF
jgi:hypothetical protein